MKLGRSGIDGTKIKANASKHKAMSYGRMQDEAARSSARSRRYSSRPSADAARMLTGSDGEMVGLPQELKRRARPPAGDPGG